MIPQTTLVQVRMRQGIRHRNALILQGEGEMGGERGGGALELRLDYTLLFAYRVEDKHLAEQVDCLVRGM